MHRSTAVTADQVATVSMPHVRRVHEESITAFPLAFGPPGVFFARAIDPDTDEPIVVRYALRR